MRVDLFKKYELFGDIYSWDNNNSVWRSPTSCQGWLAPEFEFLGDKNQLKEYKEPLVVANVVRFGDKGELLGKCDPTPWWVCFTQKERRNKTFKVVWTEIEDSQ